MEKKKIPVLFSKQQHEETRESIIRTRAVLRKTRDFLGRTREFCIYTLAVKEYRYDEKTRVKQISFQLKVN